MAKLNFADTFGEAMEDPEFSRSMRYYTGKVKLAREGDETVATFDDGRLGTVTKDNVPDSQCTIIVRGTEDHWKNLLVEYPEPFYQCLQTSAVRHGMELSNSFQTFAYLPALNRLVQLFRAKTIQKETTQ